MTLVVGAYATVGADPLEADERELLDDVLLRANGLEVPYLDGLHSRGTPWLLRRLGAEGGLVVTLVTDAVRRSAAQPRFGLASTDERGRRAAVSVAALVRDAAREAAELSGRPVVRAIEVQSAPASTRGSSATAFAESLREIAGWDWGGAELLVEHCDAARPWAAKGFLEFEDELDIVATLAPDSPTPLGVVVNWGRSAIEGRSTAAPLHHLRLAAQARLLRGLVFSGCSSRPDARGGAWADVHLPPADPNRPDDPSLLGDTEIAASLEAAGDGLSFIGLKITAQPAATPEDRRSLLRRSLAQIAR